MYAIINMNGNQLKAVPGEKLVVDNLNKEVGAILENSEVMLLTGDDGSVVVGKPFVDNVKVKLEVLDNYKGKKVIVFKKRRRQSSKVKRGFRRSLTQLKVVEIVK